MHLKILSSIDTRVDAIIDVKVADPLWQLGWGDYNNNTYDVAADEVLTSLYRPYMLLRRAVINKIHQYELSL